MKKILILLLIMLFMINYITINAENNKIKEIENLIIDWNSEIENSKLIAETIYHKSKKYKVDRRAILAIAIQESDFKQDIIGDNEEVGIMQVKPSTGKEIKKKDELLDLYKVEDNIVAGIRYYKLCRNIMYEYADNHSELLLLTFTSYNKGVWGVKNELEKGNNPINNYAESVMQLRHLILTGQLN